MVKKSVLTPVLSGILAVAVVGSGAFYFVSKNGASKDDESSSDSKKEKSSDKSVSQKVEDVKDEVAEQIDTIEKAISGDLDFAYDASLTFTPGELITSQADIKSVGINASAKQKGELTGFTLSGSYDGKTLATANIVGDRSGGNLYAQVPELSSTYVSVSGDQLKSMIEQSVQAPLESYVERSQDAMQAYGDGTSSQAIDAVDPMAQYNELLEAVESIDVDALEKDVEEYAQLVIDNFPEGKDKDNTTGTVDGVTYELTTKEYDVTYGDAQKIAKEIITKAKDDSIIKDFLDQDVIKEATGMSSADYTTTLDQALSELDAIDDSMAAESIISFDVLFDGDEAVGFNIDYEGFKMYEVVTIVDDTLVVDVKLSGDGMDMTIAGAVVDTDDTLNGSIKAAASQDGEQFTLTYTLTEVKVVDDVLSGTIGIDAEVDGQTVSVLFVSNSTADKTDLTISALMNSQKAFDFNFLLQETGASDITVPADAIAINLETGEGAEEYAATLDLEGFQANLKSALGDELYNEIFGAGDYNYDYDAQYNDYEA